MKASPARAERPRASIIIPNWNGARFLAPCLDALDAQSLGDLASGAFETIVVDNGSQDDSLEILASYRGIRMIGMPQNLGFAAAVNIGIRAARSEIIVLLNNDTEASPAWLEALIQALESAPEAGMASSKVRLWSDRKRLHTTGDSLSPAGMAGNRGAWQIDQGQFDAVTEVFGANAAAAAYRRSLFEDVGDFEEAFGSYMEDVDLAWRARLAGWTCVFAPEALVYHHLSATGGGPVSSYLVARNRIYCLVRNQPIGLLLRHAPAILAAQLGIAGSALRAWRGEAARATLRGQLAGLLGWPRMLRARRRIQAGRRIDLAAIEALMRAEP